MQQSTEKMSIVWTVLSRRKNLTRQGKERPWIMVKIVNVKNGLWVGDLVLL